MFHCTDSACSPTEGHFVCFEFLMIMIMAAISICTEIFVWTYVHQSVG